MNSENTKATIVSLILMLPALFLSTAGLLYVIFDFEAANQFVGSMMAHTVFKCLLSPFVVLGGPLLAFLLNAWKVLHFSADFVNEEFVVALSIKRLVGHLACMAIAGGLMLLLMTYAFVENFKIVGR